MLIWMIASQRIQYTPHWLFLSCQTISTVTPCTSLWLLLSLFPILNHIWPSTRPLIFSLCTCGYYSIFRHFCLFLLFPTPLLLDEFYITNFHHRLLNVIYHHRKFYWTCFYYSVPVARNGIFSLKWRWFGQKLIFLLWGNTHFLVSHHIISSQGIQVIQGWNNEYGNHGCKFPFIVSVE